MMRWESVVGQEGDMDELMMTMGEDHEEGCWSNSSRRHHQVGDGDVDGDEEEESSTNNGSRSGRNKEAVVRMRWDKLLPRLLHSDSNTNPNPNPNIGGSVCLRVLLVEGDDSTRQIIAALLRKCSYQVAAVSDGLKAWKMLQSNPKCVDVVLAEVELPSSISGITLLSMIMEHPTCTNIPVIMMSSHDSINLVFKCMLKGAADFLVKPIRKNELINLWQHVWRRNTLCSGSTKSRQGDTPDREFETNPHNANRLPSPKSNKVCSEKGSDAQSSCTRSGMEAESAYKNSAEPLQITCKGSPHFCDDICAEDGSQTNRLLVDQNTKDEGKSIMVGSESAPVNGTSIANEQLLEEERSSALVDPTNDDLKPVGSMCNDIVTNDMEDQTCIQVTPPKQIFDLIGAIDNQRQFGYGINPRNDAPEVTFHGDDLHGKSNSALFLELSLRRHPHSSVDMEEINECNTLKHSDSSAFSLYNRKAPSPFSRTVNSEAEGEGEEYYNTSTKQLPDKAFGNHCNIPRWNGTVQNVSCKEVECPNFGSFGQNGIAIKCSPIRVIPVPIPVGEMPFGTSAAYHLLKQPAFSPESSGHLMWSSSPPKGQEAICMNDSNYSETGDSCTSHKHPHNLPSKSPILYSAQVEHRKVNTEIRDEPWHVANSVLGDVVSSHISHDGSASHINSANGLFNDGNISTPKISQVTAELRNREQQKQADLYRLNQREAALNKFRLKRKERCYEKKVRYQSRKRLAEQRPRVKGQFVRHIQSDAPSTMASSHQVEQAVG